jgi:GGDEF domain-containing protein
VAGDVRVTLSVGVADDEGAGPDAEGAGADAVERLLARADQALYEVKRRGRDGVSLTTR